MKTNFRKAINALVSSNETDHMILYGIAENAIDSRIPISKSDKDAIEEYINFKSEDKDARKRNPRKH